MIKKPWHVQLSPGQTLEVGFVDETGHQTDGAITIEFGRKILSVYADMPDSNGREGVIYAEKF